MNILIIDDDILEYEIIHRAYKEEHNLFWCSKIFQAETLLTVRKDIDLIICDFMGTFFLDFKIEIYKLDFPHDNMVITSNSVVPFSNGIEFIHKEDLVEYIKGFKP